MTHPSSLDLERFAVGERLAPGLERHIQECSACEDFVGQLRTLVASAPSHSASEAEAAVARALAGLSASDPLRDLSDVASDRRPANDETAARPEQAARSARSTHPEQATRPEQAARPARPASTRRPRQLWFFASSILAPLAAAAAIVVLARGTFSASVTPPQPESRAPAASDTLQMGALPPDTAARLAAGRDTQFKGGMHVAVVRDRGGIQTRFSSSVPVRPGDRLRIEVALDHEQAILGAVLSDDGTILELMPQQVRGPGTHFSERSAKIDGVPTRGRVVVGSPEAIARARDTKQFDGVTSLRVDWEQP